MSWRGWLAPVAAAVLIAIALVAARAQRSRRALTELLTLIPRCLALLRDILRDPAVPRRAKLAPALAVVYLALPLDLIPDFIPGLGQLDDALILAWALRRLIAAAGRDRATQHWRGQPETLDRILRLARALDEGSQEGTPGVGPPLLRARLARCASGSWSRSG